MVAWLSFYKLVFKKKMFLTVVYELEIKRFDFNIKLMLIILSIFPLQPGKPVSTTLVDGMG